MKNPEVKVTKPYATIQTQMFQQTCPTQDQIEDKVQAVIALPSQIRGLKQYVLTFLMEKPTQQKNEHFQRTVAKALESLASSILNCRCCSRVQRLGGRAPKTELGFPNFHEH